MMQFHRVVSGQSRESAIRFCIPHKPSTSEDGMPTLDTHRLSLQNISLASKTIDPVFLNTPQFKSETLSKALNYELTLKLETTNPIGSFKGRGASFFLQQV